MRGAKRDIAITRLLHANGLLLDKRSFISLGAEPHLYLKGPDMILQRERVWLKWKGSDPAPRCYLKLEGCDFYAAELDHKQGGLVGRCDCEHNLGPACVNCHRAKHVRPRFRRIPQLTTDQNFFDETDARVKDSVGELK
jgi:hypothetical protein